MGATGGASTLGKRSGGGGVFGNCGGRLIGE